MAAPIPEGEFRFYEPVKVRFNETDLQGHVNFIWYAAYFDAAVGEYFRAIGYTYKEMLEGGVDLYYVGTGTDLHARAFYEDRLNVYARIARIGNTSLRFEFAVRKQESNDLVASGFISAVCVGVESKRPVRVPEGLREAVARYQETDVRDD